VTGEFLEEALIPDSGGPVYQFSRPIGLDVTPDDIDIGELSAFNISIEIVALT